MPNTKSAAKAMHSSAKKRVVNLRIKNKVKREIKEVRKFLDQDLPDKAAAKLKDAMSALDKAAKKGIVKKNTASRKKSRLAKSINKKVKK